MSSDYSFLPKYLCMFLVTLIPILSGVGGGGGGGEDTLLDFYQFVHFTCIGDLLFFSGKLQIQLR